MLPICKRKLVGGIFPFASLPPSALLSVMPVSLHWSDFVHYNILAMPFDGTPLFSLLDNSPNVDIFGEKPSGGWWKFLVCQIGLAFSVDVHFSMLSLISITEGKHVENVYLECWRSIVFHSPILDHYIDPKKVRHERKRGKITNIFLIFAKCGFADKCDGVPNN